jgi:hypothetical protein
MADVGLPRPLEAYCGDEPYLFASYAHSDAEDVYPDLALLGRERYRIWYDEGIDPGNEWPEEVAEALADASHFLVFISPSAVASRNVRNEINFALRREMPFLAVYVSETKLPPGLELQMGTIQAVMRYRMNPDSYLSRLRRTLPASLRSSGGRQGAPGITTAAGAPRFTTEDTAHILRRVLAYGGPVEAESVVISQGDSPGEIVAVFKREDLHPGIEAPDLARAGWVIDDLCTGARLSARIDCEEDLRSVAWRINVARNM